MIRFIFSMALLIPVGVMSWRIGENITPEIVAMGTGMLFMLAAGVLGAIALFIMMKFTAGERANERGHNAQARQLEQRQQQPPVLIVMPSDRGRIEERGRDRGYQITGDRRNGGGW